MIAVSALIGTGVRTYINPVEISQLSTWHTIVVVPAVVGFVSLIVALFKQPWGKMSVGLLFAVPYYLLVTLIGFLYAYGIE